MTNDTYSRTFLTSLRSAALTYSLVSRLKEQLSTDGSTIYKQQWKQKVTPLGTVYWAHTASARRTFDSDCTGWPTTAARDVKSNQGSGGMGDTEHDGCIASKIKGSDGEAICDSQTGTNSTGESKGASASESISWIYCRDNKYRPIESGLKPLVDGVPRGMVHSGDSRNTQEARKMRLKGYGNAIVPALAAEFIMAYTKSMIRR